MRVVPTIDEFYPQEPDQVFQVKGRENSIYAFGQGREKLPFRSMPRAFWFSFFKYYFLFILFIFILWLCWVFVSVWGLSLVAASGGHSSSWCAGLSPSRPLLLQSTGSRRAGSVVVAHGPSCSAACRILPDQGSNPCPLHWQADSQPLHHQGSPDFLNKAWTQRNYFTRT